MVRAQPRAARDSVRDAFAHLERAILGAGIPLGAAALTREQTRALLERGHRLPVHGFDVLMLAGLVRQTAEWRQDAAQAGARPERDRH